MGMQVLSDYRMQINWNQKTTEWFWRASRYTGFHRELAKILLDRIDHKDTLCDLGCGAGMIDFELAKEIKSITCIDRSDQVIDLLDGKIKELGFSNMQAKCQDIHYLQGKWDTAIMLFVGDIARYIGDYLSMCNDKIIIVDRGGCINNPLGGQVAKKTHSLLPLINEMEKAGIHYEMTDYTLEYGQPFVNKQEIYDYVSLYHKNPPHMSISDYIAKNVVETGHSVYPYYLPYQKHFGVFEIKKEDNLHLVR